MARLRMPGLTVLTAAALAAGLWGAAAQGQERPVLGLAEAGAERLVVGWTWREGEEEPAGFSVLWRLRASGAGWESARAEGAARRFEITGLRPESAYIVRVRALDARGRGVRVGGGRPFDLRGVFDTIQLPVPGAPRVAFDGERAVASWDAVEGATGYELEWGAAGAAEAERVGAGVLEFETGELAAGRRYEFRVRSLHGRDRSELSAAAVLATAAWPHAAPAARFEFHRAAGMLVEWEAVAGVERYVVAWEREGDAGRSGEMEAEGTSALVTREGGFFTGSWLLRVRAAGGGLWSEKTRVWVESPAPELRFSLESSRELCTEGTLTEVRWRGGGGAGNLWPHVNGRMIGENTYRVKVNCGMIPRGEDGEIDESRRNAVITGFLRDGRGVVRSASIRVPRAEALPAPTGLEASNALLFSVVASWDSVQGAGVHSPPTGENRQRLAYGLRHRTKGAATWELEIVNDLKHPAAQLIGPAGAERELMVAAFRHPIEIETPDALNWTDAVASVLPTPPQNVTAETTHDSVIVRFDKQPLGPGGIIVVRGDGVPGRKNRTWIEDGTSGRHEIEVGGLPPDTPVRVAVAVGRLQDTLGIEPLRLRTKPALDGWTEPGRGVRNLRVSATPTSVTAQWEAPPGEQEHWWTVSVLEILGSDRRTIDHGAVFTDFDDGPPFGFTTSGGGIYHRVGPGRTYQFRIGEIFFGGSIEPAVVSIATPRRAGDASPPGSQAGGDPIEAFPHGLIPEFAPSWWLVGFSPTLQGARSNARSGN